jgi:hypothetical protein
MRLGLLPKKRFSVALSCEELGLSVVLSVTGSVSSVPSLGTRRTQRRKAFGCWLESTLPMLVIVVVMLDICKSGIRS